MLSISGAFSGFSVIDTREAAAFYRDVVGLQVSEAGMGGIMRLDLPGGGHVILYPKDDHQPATYTVLNVTVPDIDAAVAQLAEAGVSLLRYEGFPQDEHGLMRSTRPEDGPTIGWFTDPSGNIVALMADEG